jgi:hypothetical protein
MKLRDWSKGKREASFTLESRLSLIRRVTRVSSPTSAMAKRSAPPSSDNESESLQPDDLGVGSSVSWDFAVEALVLTHAFSSLLAGKARPYRGERARLRPRSGRKRRWRGRLCDYSTGPGAHEAEEERSRTLGPPRFPVVNSVLNTEYLQPVPESGVIEEVLCGSFFLSVTGCWLRRYVDSLIDFMCHRRVQASFGPKINFLIGHNGSESFHLRLQ